MQVPVIESERLVLRGWREADLDAYAAVCADAETMHFLGGPLSREDTWRRMAMFVGHWELRAFGMWVLEERKTGAFVGRCGVWMPEGWPMEEISYTLAPAFRGRGFATEAARAARDWGFAALGLGALCSLIRPENAPSIRVAERLGATRERVLPIRGHDTILFRYDR